MDAAALSTLLQSAAPGATVEPLGSIDMPTIAVDREHLLDVFAILRDDPSLQFAFLVDVTAVDLLPASPRFEMVYHLACLGPHYLTAGATQAATPSRLRVKVRLPGDDARVPSVVSLYPTAGWPEREVFDLFGIAFDGHPDLRRILMPDDWQGHPLRKDYPVQIRKDAAAWSPLQMTPEEFARNVRAGREQATRDARPSGPQSDKRD
ncbi:MAG TPA: NADH-quinone oxidoreductase subunit C [Vicinamibacterales bacterium]|nr:NADH-quinone oxidoreductase subunit C [Vicinamibacterales bacterium]